MSNKDIILNKMEETFQLPVKPSINENVDDVKKFIEKLENAFNLTLCHQNTEGMITNFSNDRLSFEQTLDAYDDDEALKIKTYIYFALAFRKYYAYTIPKVDIDLRFKLADFLYYGSIKPKIFQSFEDIPKDIFPRVLDIQNASKERIEVEKYYKNVVFLFHQIENLKNQLVTESDSEKQDKIEKEIWNRKNKINDILDDKLLEIISFYKTVLKVPKPSEIAAFINHFLNFGIMYKKLEFDELKLVDNSNIISKEQYISHESLHNTYIFSESENVWKKLKHIDRKILSRVCSNMNLNDKNKVNTFVTTLKDKILQSKEVSAIKLCTEAIHLSNGTITYQVNDNGTLSYQFTHIDDMSMHDKMFKFATDLRLVTLYNPNARYVFDDNAFNEPVTPAYIFDNLSSRGYKPSENVPDSVNDAVVQEAKNRLNSLLQFSLKTIYQFDSEKPSAVKDTFLYFYSGAESGKSTFMALMSNFFQLPNRDTDEDDEDLKTPVTNMSIADLTGEGTFGAINLKGKSLALIDEAFDGDARNKIEMELLKQVSANQNITTNKKNSGYQGFQSKASIILASNYQPIFVDESGGSERRILAFDLSESPAMNDQKIDLPFIKTHLINTNEFQSACIRYILDNVNFYQEKAPSIKEEARKIVSREDDVQEFIDKVRKSITKPIIIQNVDLHKLYVEFSKIVNDNNRPRNISNFKKAVEKIGGGIRLEKLTVVKTQIYNHTIYLYNTLFDNIYRDSINSRDFDHLARAFSMLSKERNDNLVNIHDKLKKVADNQEKLQKSRIDRLYSPCFVILPDDEIHENADLYKLDFSKFVKDIRDDFFSKLITKETLKIFHDAHSIDGISKNNLPLIINDELSTSFNMFTTDAKSLDRTYVENLI